MLVLPEFLMFPLGGNEEMWLSMKDGDKKLHDGEESSPQEAYGKKEEAEREYAKMKNETKYEQKMEHVLADSVMMQIKLFSYLGAVSIEKENSEKMKELLLDLGYRILAIENASENKCKDRFIYSCAPYFIEESNSKYLAMSAKKVSMRIKTRIDKEVSSMFDKKVYVYRRVSEDGERNVIMCDFDTPSIDFKDEILRRLYREGYDVNVIFRSLRNIKMSISWNPESQIGQPTHTDETSDGIDDNRKKELTNLFTEAVESKILSLEYECSIPKYELCNEMEYKYIEQMAKRGGFYLPNGCDLERTPGNAINVSWHPYQMTKGDNTAIYTAAKCAERTKKKIDDVIRQANIEIDRALESEDVSALDFRYVDRLLRNGNVEDALRENLTKRNLKFRTIDGGITVYTKKE
jgi:hypothetical protein